jgi:LmbE family N-acetylglucosaminyl deacetylase
MENKTILVVAAHPDDEVLGCGGTMARYSRAGHKVLTLILAEGLTSRRGEYDRNHQAPEMLKLVEAAQRANDILGVSSLTLKGFPDNRMDSLDRLEVIREVERFIQATQPEIVYTHHRGDLNIDHQITHEAVTTACRPMPGQPVTKLCFFEVPSSTEWQVPAWLPAFVPNYFVEISDTLGLKLEALGAYCSEIRPWPHARSIEAVEHLARWRGATAGVSAAEAFVLGREVKRMNRQKGESIHDNE